MTQKIAVAIIHGVGRQEAEFADRMCQQIQDCCATLIQPHTALPAEQFVFGAVHWAPVLQALEDDLWTRLNQGGAMNLDRVRRFMIDFLADAVAYQQTPGDRWVYDGIHKVFAQTLSQLAEAAGPSAPLCIVAHSLGSIITSNYLYDLQTDPARRIINDEVRSCIGNTPLERGETLALFYTMGSPIALWSLRYREFGRPIRIPAPRLAQHYPTLPAEWINFYDQEDVVAFPLKTLNEAYSQVVTEDRIVNVGGLLESWNPISHMRYWTDTDVTTPIAEGLARAWKAINAAGVV